MLCVIASKVDASERGSNCYNQDIKMAYKVLRIFYGQAEAHMSDVPADASGCRRKSCERAKSFDGESRSQTTAPKVAEWSWIGWSLWGNHSLIAADKAANGTGLSLSPCQSCPTLIPTTKYLSAQNSRVRLNLSKVNEQSDDLQSDPICNIILHLHMSHQWSIDSMARLCAHIWGLK